MFGSKTIKNNVLKSGKVEWRKLDIIQPKDFKQISEESYTRLKTSLVKNQLIEPLNVWSNGKKNYCLDGVHRIRVLFELEKEGYEIPKLLPANFIRCRDRKEAARFVLIYSSIYANVTHMGLSEFLSSEGLNIEDIKMDVELPVIDFNHFGEKFTPPSGGGEREIDENIKTQNKCPQCGYKW
jgi:hypothetical protein